MEGRLVTAEAKLEPFRAGWESLAVSAGRPFAHPGWVLAWWRYAAPPGAELRVALALEEGRLRGVAPFYLAPGRAPVTTYRLLASPVSSRVEPVAAEEDRDAAARAFAEVLAAAPHPPHALAFDGVPAGSRWPSRVRAAWPGRAPLLAVDRAETAPLLSVEGRTYEDWLAGQTGHFRKRMRRARRQIEEEGGRFRLASESTLERDLAAFERLHEARWAARGGSGVVTPEVGAMLRAVDLRLLRVWCLEAEGALVAVEVLLSAGGETSFWLGGFAEGKASWQPSLQTMLRAVEHAFESEDRVVDLGEGDQPFKRRLADGEDALQWALLVPHGRRLPVAMSLLAAGRARRALAERTPASVKRVLGRSPAAS